MGGCDSFENNIIYIGFFFIFVLNLFIKFFIVLKVIILEESLLLIYWKIRFIDGFD